MSKSRQAPLAMVCALAIMATLSATACSDPIQNREPLGETFPTVQGQGLDNRLWELPMDLTGPTVLIVGYVQDAQFDIDRWLLGLLQADLKVDILEVPTIDALVPTVISERIDAGMRSGIPKEDWKSVVTVYGEEAEKIVAFTGNTSPRNARVVLLDEAGTVRWFHDRGFSAGLVLKLQSAVGSLETP